MVLVRNIQKDKEIIKFDYFPENDSEVGHIEYNCKIQEIISQTKTPYDIAMDYAGHALDAVKRILEQGKEFPKELCEMWY